MKKLQIIIDDPWLEPCSDDVFIRYQRYQERLKEITSSAGSLENFAQWYDYFGVNYDSTKKGWHYREWAPRAHALYLMGDFNQWNRRSHPLKNNGSGVWEIFLPDEKYKNSFLHKSKIKVVVIGGGKELDRIPVWIKRVVQDEESKDYNGQVWLQKHFDWENDSCTVKKDDTLFIYECHTGMAQEKEGVGTFNEFTENMIPRIKKAGYNVIQMMAVQEHPYYGSFGYHVSNFFAVSSRFGSPEDLKNLIKTAHKAGLAVIMDIGHSHSVKNINEGISDFDGSDGLYFHTLPRGEHPTWDSRLFDYGKWEVLQFLLANTAYWIKEFHFDGFRFDGVGSMMYFHHGDDVFDRPEKYFREGVEWDAITYLQLANQLIHEINPQAISIAEDVTGMPGLTSPIDDGGIGFDYRLGMGIPDYWIKTLKEEDDDNRNIEQMWNVLNDRKPNVNTITYCESHDQALVGDKTLAFRLMDKEMYWNMDKSLSHLDIDRGIALHKMIRFFTILNGGQAYLNFMGNEFGHPEWIDFPRVGNNWSYKNARRQWSLIQDKSLKYHFLSDFDKEMLVFVKKNRLLAADYGKILNIDNHNKTIVFEKANLIFVFNWHPSNSIASYEIPIEKEGSYKIIFNTDNEEFGGFQRIDDNVVYASFNKEKQLLLPIYNVNRTALVFAMIS